MARRSCVPPVARADQPSPFTRHGPSVNGAVKPDVVDYGGNMLVDARAGNRPMEGQQGVGEISTSHSFTLQQPFVEYCGTSFAAPRISHSAAIIFRELPHASVDLCRALLVAHAQTPDACAELLGENREELRNITGYGLVDRSALYRSLEDCVTLWAEESIENRQHHFYEIPIPEEFWKGDPRARKVTVALAHRPPVRTTRLDYRAAAINFKLVRSESLEKVVQWFNATVEKDDDMRVSEYALGRSLSEEVRSKGTVQSSTWSFKIPSNDTTDASWFVVVTRNDPSWGTSFSSEREGYAVVVKLADRSEVQASLFTQVQLYTRIETQLRERIRIRN